LFLKKYRERFWGEEKGTDRTELEGREEDGALTEEERRDSFLIDRLRNEGKAAFSLSLYGREKCA